jgi:hypothetical protein
VVIEVMGGWKDMKMNEDSTQWIEHFRANRARACPADWEDGHILAESERLAISRSIATFQLGESSAGGHFQRKADEFAGRSGDEAYGEAVRLFIKEENHHAYLLGEFMDRHRIPRIYSQWTDAIFRRIRKLADLELCVRVLVAAEIVAKVYYKALRDCTNSAALRQICTVILQDEVHHIVFQTSAIFRLQKNRSRLRRLLATIAYRLFMGVTILVVWKDHRAVLKQGHYSFTRFVGEVLCETEDALLLMNGEWDVVHVRADAELIDKLLLRAAD